MLCYGGPPAAALATHRGTANRRGRGPRLNAGDFALSKRSPCAAHSILCGATSSATAMQKCFDEDGVSAMKGPGRMRRRAMTNEEVQPGDWTVGSSQRTRFRAAPTAPCCLSTWPLLMLLAGTLCMGSPSAPVRWRPQCTVEVSSHKRKRHLRAPGMSSLKCK
jgi:hypothetical protein